MADDQEDSGPGDGLDQRVAKLETGQSTLEDKVDKILGIVSGGHGEDGGQGGHEEQPSGGPTIAHEIRAQLDERDRKAAAEAERQAGSDRLAAAEAKLAELSEKPPEPMPRRVERIMGWR